MLFGRPLLAVASLVTASFALTYFLFVQVGPREEENYRTLAQESSRLKGGHTAVGGLEKEPAHQLRTGVQKDIWTLDGKERLHIRLKSDHSELVLHQKGKKFEAVEELQNLQYWMQDQLDPLLNLQQVRFLCAAEGVYHFPAQCFATKKVHLSFFRLPGLDLPTHTDALPFLDGIAQEMRGDVIQGNFSCQGPSGYFIPTLSSDPLYFSGQTLVWKKPAEEITLSGDVSFEQPDKFTIESDHARLTLQHETEPAFCHCTGHVQLFAPHLEGKPSFALAGTLTFSPLDQTIVLSSAPPNRVLFWQEGCSLSAPEVHLVKHPLTHKESIQGKGDVHFSFDSEEKNLIQELLSKYL